MSASLKRSNPGMKIEEIGKGKKERPFIEAVVKKKTTEGRSRIGKFGPNRLLTHHKR